MPRTKEGLARLIAREGLRDKRIVDAFQTVDRAGFVPPGSEGAAYRDRPVAIPDNQTTSQPSLIARMIDAAAPKPGDKVLEVGTGYGFQTALLARLCRRVISVERWPDLAEAARANLERAGIDSAEVVVGDGWEGYSEESPFDAILVSAAADELPSALAAQLGEGGRMVIPIEEPSGDNVYLFEKQAGRVEKVALIAPARFVPLVRGEPE